MTDRELMQQALEKLDFFAHMKSVSEDTIRLIADLRERLAQPVQEPFCYHDGHNIVGKEYADHSDVFPLYTSPNLEQQKPVRFKCTVIDDANPNGVPLSQWGKPRTTDRGPVAWLPPDPPPECKSEAEKTAFAFGWFKALEKERLAKEEAIYETIIQWDEGGGKRSRRELARRIVALYAKTGDTP